jgi:hypothetical protein
MTCQPLNCNFCERKWMGQLLNPAKQLRDRAITFTVKSGILFKILIKATR